MNRIFMWVGGFLLTVVAATSGAAPSNAELGLPAPETLLLSVTKPDYELNFGVFSAIADLCRLDTLENPGNAKGQERKRLLCGLPAKVNRFKALASEILAGGKDVEVRTGVSRVNAWDLREFIAGHVMEVPNRDGVKGAGLKPVVELLVLRSEIARELGLIQTRLGSPVQSSRDIHQIVLIPSLQAHIQSASGVGTMMALFDSIRCQTADRFCELIKDRFGAALAAALEPHMRTFAAFQERIAKISADDAPERSRRLRAVYRFARELQASSAPGRKFMTAPEIEARLVSLTADGQGIFVQENYAELAKEVIAVGEMANVLARYESLSPYRGALSKEEKYGAQKTLAPEIQSSIQAIERAMQSFAMSNEMAD